MRKEAPHNPGYYKVRKRHVWCEYIGKRNKETQEFFEEFGMFDDYELVSPDGEIIAQSKDEKALYKMIGQEYEKKYREGEDW